MRDSLRKMLARFGIALFRFPSNAGVPPTLVQYLQSLSDRRIELGNVFSFDNEAQIQKELLSVFPADQVLFVSCPSRGCETSDFPGITLVKPPRNRFLIEIDIESFNLDRLANDIPWFVEADVILLRSTLGYFWSGGGDLQRIANLLDNRGFSFFDALEYFKLHLLNAPLGRVVFVFENRKLKLTAQVTDKTNKGTAAERERLKRIKDGLVFLSNPIARSSEFVRLGGRGSFGFAAGVVNPGAIADGDGVILLARGERIPWSISKHNLSDFLHGCRPVLFELNDKLDVSHVAEAAFINAVELADSRMEDFRLFRSQNQLFSSHSWVATPDGNPPGSEPVRLESLRIRIGISQVDLKTKEVKFLGTPQLDCATGLAEKNWVFFEHQNELFLIYSFNPFRLLRANRWPQMDFTTVACRNLSISSGDDQLKFRNSVNPVEYNQEYFLHIVHKVYPGKQYVFWGVLIERKSLLPKMISTRPLVCGWKSAPASIIYACSLIVRKDDIVVFAGLNDSSMGFWKIARHKLDENWIHLENPNKPEEN